MKYEEAKQGMKYEEAKQGLISCVDCSWCGGCGVRDEAVDVAVEALEKQIPKKVNVDDFTRRFHCPICGNWVLRDSMSDYGGTRFCDECGQALDWSESKG